MYTYTKEQKERMLAKDGNSDQNISFGEKSVSIIDYINLPFTKHNT